MPQKEQYTVELTPRQHAWLEEMAVKHGLVDGSKAMRCLVNYAHSHPEHQSVIFDEIRCQDCG